MTGPLLYLAVAAILTAYVYWVYTRVELRVAAARRLAVVRAIVLCLVLLLLFNPRLPFGDGSGAPVRWVLLDASLSMTAEGVDDVAAWDRASERAGALAAQGWTLVGFGDEALTRLAATEEAVPDRPRTRLAPALEAAAEVGVREVVVLTDARLEDAVSVRSALATLPLQVRFERFDTERPNAGIARFEIADVARVGASPVAELEVFADGGADSVRVEVLEEQRPVASVTVPAPSPGLRTAVSVPLPVPAAEGRVRYVARRFGGDDAFADDDVAVAYAAVGFEEGGVVVISVRPDWEPRHLMPVLEEVTGLSSTGYLRVGVDRWVPLGRASDRGGPVDSTVVRQAAFGATILVVHGLHGGSEPWVAEAARAPGRRLVFPVDAEGSALAGFAVEGARPGEWYASADVPTSPITGALSGVRLEGLPPLGNVLVPEPTAASPPLLVQLRGAGPPQAALALVERPEGRSAFALASGFWRWGMRDAGREPYRRLWSGVAGWLLGDRGTAAAEPRPTRWVFDRHEPITWRLPAEPDSVRVRVASDGEPLVDSLIGAPSSSIGALPPGSYTYAAVDDAGDTLSSGRFDVASTTLEMLPRPIDAEMLSAAPASEDDDLRAAGPRLRTSPWPYLLAILLLCGEWIARRRSGLR